VARSRGRRLSGPTAGQNDACSVKRKVDKVSDSTMRRPAESYHDLFYLPLLCFSLIFSWPRGTHEKLTWWICGPYKTANNQRNRVFQKKKLKNKVLLVQIQISHLLALLTHTRSLTKSSALRFIWILSTDVANSRSTGMSYTQFCIIQIYFYRKKIYFYGVNFSV
jgi:hypothetical protein